MMTPTAQLMVQTVLIRGYQMRKEPHRSKEFVTVHIDGNNYEVHQSLIVVMQHR